MRVALMKQWIGLEQITSAADGSSGDGSSGGYNILFTRVRRRIILRSSTQATVDVIIFYGGRGIICLGSGLGRRTSCDSEGEQQDLYRSG